MIIAITYLVAVTALCVFTVAYARYEDNRDRETFARLQAANSPRYIMKLHGNGAYGPRHIQQGPRHVIKAAYRETRAIYPSVKITIRDMKTGRFASLK